MCVEVLEVALCTLFFPPFICFQSYFSKAWLVGVLEFMAMLTPNSTSKQHCAYALLGTNISPPKVCLSRWFSGFPVWWDMLLPWRAIFFEGGSFLFSSSGPQLPETFISSAHQGCQKAFSLLFPKHRHFDVEDLSTGLLQRVAEAGDVTCEKFIAMYLEVPPAGVSRQTVTPVDPWLQGVSFEECYWWNFKKDVVSQYSCLFKWKWLALLKVTINFFWMVSKPLSLGKCKVLPIKKMQIWLWCLWNRVAWPEAKTNCNLNKQVRNETVMQNSSSTPSEN